MVTTGKNTVLSSYKFEENTFMRGFLADLYLRPSCHACPAKGGTSGADITIADYWGIQNVRPSFYDKSGVGLAIVHTSKGLNAFDAAKFETEETTLQEAVAGNPAYRESKAKPNKRQSFFVAFSAGRPIEDIVKDCLRISLPRWIVRNVKTFAKRVLQKLLP